MQEIVSFALGGKRIKKIDNSDKLTIFCIGNIELYFSYESIIGYYDRELYICGGIWSNTTCKHIKKVERMWDSVVKLSKEEFLEQLNEVDIWKI